GGAGNDIRFNPTTAAALAVSGTGNFTAPDQLIINANGANASIAAGSISGTVTATGNVGNFAATTTSSGLTISGVTATGTALATAGNGPLSVTSLSGTTVNLNVTAGGDLLANSVTGSGAVALVNSSNVAGDDIVIGGTGLSSTGSTVSMTS